MLKNGEVDPAIKAYVIERDKAFRSLDIAWARKQDRRNLSDSTLLAAMHKARLHSNQIEEHYKDVSRKWLTEKGFSHDFF